MLICTILAMIGLAIGIVATALAGVAGIGSLVMVATYWDIVLISAMVGFIIHILIVKTKK